MFSVVCVLWHARLADPLGTLGTAAADNAKLEGLGIGHVRTAAPAVDVFGEIVSVDSEFADGA